MNPKPLLKKFTGLRHCLMTGRGATAIYLILKALRLPSGSEVIMPSFLCTSPAAVTILAGLRPVFCDISLEDCNISAETVSRVISPKTKVILAPHMFGSPIDMKPLMELAKLHSIFVIEDCAQYIDFKHKRKSDAVVFSFGKTKLAEAGYGGAVLTDNTQLYQTMAELEAKLPEAQQTTQEEYYKLMKTSLEKQTPISIQQIEANRRLFLFKYSNSHAPEILKSINELPNNLKKRQAAASTLIRELPLRHIGASQRPFHRACFMVESSVLRDKLVKDIRASNRWVGTLYEPIHPVFSSIPNSEFPNSCYASSHIINFILAPDVLKREPLQETIRIVKKRIAKPQKILMLGGSHFYAPAIPIIQGLKVEVVLVDRDPEPVGKPIADYFENVDIVDVPAVLAVARKYDIDGAMAVNDYGVVTAAKVASTLGLIANSEGVALATVEKAKMRLKWASAGVPIPKFRMIHTLEEAEQAVPALGGFPVILKPSGNMGASRGILRASSYEELTTAFREAIQYDHNILAEEYVTGTEHSVEGVVQNGRVTILGISQKIKTKEPFRVDLAVYYPSQLNKEQRTQVEATVTKAALSLGMEHGAIHAELCFTSTGPVMFEIASRPGGGRIPSDCLPLYNGTNQTEALTKILLGNSFAIHKTPEKGVVLGFIIAKPGEIVDVSACKQAEQLEYVHVCEPLKPIGARVNPVKAGGDRAGYFIVTAKTIEKAIDYYKELASQDLIITR